MVAGMLSPEQDLMVRSEQVAWILTNYTSSEFVRRAQDRARQPSMSRSDVEGRQADLRSRARRQAVVITAQNDIPLPDGRGSARRRSRLGKTEVAVRWRLGSRLPRCVRYGGGLFPALVFRSSFSRISCRRTTRPSLLRICTESFASLSPSHSMSITPKLAS